MQTDNKKNKESKKQTLNGVPCLFEVFETFCKYQNIMILRDVHKAWQ